MLQTLLAKVVGTQNERELKRLRPLVMQVNALEPALKSLSDEQLRAKTAEFKLRVAPLPAYLNALEGKGVHVVTVNDYLARRDSEWMVRIYRFLGLTVGVIQHDLTDAERQVAYAADITYGTNNEFGFDYLRDNMKFELAHYVQRGHQFAIVDEVDSILIDEARTPLIISGPAEESTELYYQIDRIIPRLKRAATIVEGKLSEVEAQAPGDYIVDEKSKAVS